MWPYSARTSECLNCPTTNTTPSRAHLRACSTVCRDMNSSNCAAAQAPSWRRLPGQCSLRAITRWALDSALRQPAATSAGREVRCSVVRSTRLVLVADAEGFGRLLHTARLRTATRTRESVPSQRKRAWHGQDWSSCGPAPAGCAPSSARPTPLPPHSRAAHARLRSAALNIHSTRRISRAPPAARGCPLAVSATMATQPTKDCHSHLQPDNGAGSYSEWYVQRSGTSAARPFILCLGAVRFAARLKANGNIGDRSEAEALSFSTTVEPSAVVPPWTRLPAACHICTVLHCAQLSAHNCQTSTCCDE